MDKRNQDWDVFSDLLTAIVEHEVSMDTIDQITNLLNGKTPEEADALVAEYTRKIKAGQIK